MTLSDLLQGCSNKSDTVMIINKNVTRLTTQGCNNIVISWLYRTCWNNLVTSLVISTKLLQIVNSLFQTCWQLGTNSAGTTCWQTCYNMWDFCVYMTQVFFLLVPLARGCMIFAEVVNTNLCVQDSYRSPVGVARIFPENQNWSLRRKFVTGCCSWPVNSATDWR
jgi:hypothetical protein